MAITPEQIRNQEFPMRLKGYDPETVRAFLQDVAQAYRATIRDQGAQWALANISDDLAAVLRAAHDTADKVVALGESEAAEARAKAEAEARSIVADANRYATSTRTAADEAAAEALERLHQAQREAEDVTRDASEAKQLLESAEEEARRVRAEAEAEITRLRTEADDQAAQQRREATEHRESARLLLERTQQEAAELLRAAEVDARHRVQTILAEAQGRLDALEQEERALQARVQQARAEFHDLVHRLVGTPGSTIDLTDDDQPIVMIDGRLHAADPLELFAEELHTERTTHLPGSNAARVDPRTVQRMVSAAVDRAVEHSRA